MFGWLFSPAPKSRIRLFNTKGRELQDFEPLNRGVMKMYSCGPTVYNYSHIGNLRAALLPDIIRRVFEYAGYKVIEVMNITDFGHLVAEADQGEDKMTKGLKREGMEPTMENMFILATKYADAYKEDMAAMNIKAPHAMPRASEHVPGMIAYIEQLMHKGFAYKTSDGIYFDVQKFPAYGVLGGSASSEYSRIGVSAEKHDPRDFTLWKLNPDMGWDSPWGKGFPGWHIECTAMSGRYLGKSFDIHAGGVDLIPIHHNNEIAQAEAANGRPYVSYWLHNEFITIDNTRIAKSLGNDILIRQLRDRGISPLAYRYWLLTGHYRQAMNFTWDAVEAAQTALYRALRSFVDMPQGGAVHAGYKEKFASALYQDLNTPEAVAVMWEMLKDESVSAADKRATLLDFDRVLGVGFSMTAVEMRSITDRTVEESALPENVVALAKERIAARARKDFSESDRLRDELKRLGFMAEDTGAGQRLTRL